MANELEPLREWHEATPDDDSDKGSTSGSDGRSTEYESERANTEAIEESLWRGSKRLGLRPVGQNTTFSQAAKADYTR